MEKSVENLLCEKLHMKFLKFSLGVNKKSTNVAVMGELGRYPLYINILLTVAKYYQRLTVAKSDELISSAFQESHKLYKNKKSSWVSSVYFLLHQIGIDTNVINNDDLIQILKNKLVHRYKKRWTDVILDSANNRTGKLRTYALFKTYMCQEKYLLVLKNQDIRKCLTSFRISAHQLEIEAGRYKNIPVNSRICKLCNSNEVEDEVHFLLGCNHYKGEREKFFDEVQLSCGNFTLLSPINKMIWLMSNEDNNIIELLANFIHDCTKKRLDFLKSPR